MIVLVLKKLRISCVHEEKSVSEKEDNNPLLNKLKKSVYQILCIRIEHNTPLLYVHVEAVRLHDRNNK